MISMSRRHEIQAELITLDTGDRLLRLSDISTGLVLEKKIDPAQSLARQRDRLLGVFDAALAHSRSNAA
jgi:hypothetical protein